MNSYRVREDSRNCFRERVEQNHHQTERVAVGTIFQVPPASVLSSLRMGSDTGRVIRGAAQ
jgi:hypothetical protein